MRLARPLSRGAIISAGVVGAVVVAGTVVAAVHFTSHGSGGGAPSAAASPITPARVELVGLRAGSVPWNKPLTIQVANGTLRTVSVAADGGSSISGSMRDGDTTWVSAQTLVPLTSYQALVSYVDQARHQLSTTITFKAADSTKHLKVTLSPGDGNTVGVGSPIIASFSRPVPTDKRAQVEERLAVTTSPAVVGAWHWMSDQEVHWRPPRYWRAGTHVTVKANLDGLYVGRGVWGSSAHETSFRIGAAHVSRVDVARHVMYVYDNGRLVRTFPISAGRDKYPTKSGVHITFERSQVVTMDSATVGIPRNSPDGYYEKVYWDVRISYGGAFVHAAPWSVGDQGRVNVSHGCVNLSTPNATWFYYFSQRGDIVDVFNSSAAPDPSDPGMADWNMSWSAWLAGSAAPSPAAKRVHAKLPRDYEPGMSSTTTKSSTTATRTPTHRPTSSPTATPSPTATRS